MSMLGRLNPKDARALERFVERVRAALGEKLVALSLFGSKARGEDLPDSDMDVLVVVDEASVEVEDLVLDIAFHVNLQHDVYISPRVISQVVFDDPVWKITPFLRTVTREGMPL